MKVYNGCSGSNHTVVLIVIRGSTLSRDLNNLTLSFVIFFLNTRHVTGGDAFIVLARRSIFQLSPSIGIALL